MNGSYVFLLHIIVFGVVAGTIIPSFVLDRKLRAEQDWGRKLYIGGIMRVFGAFVPYNVALLVITGLGNMYNRYLDAPYPWYDEHWLVTKVALFVVLAFNALFVVPKVGMKRGMLIKAIVDKSAPIDAEQQVEVYNKKISRLFLVQTALLLVILFLSAFGTGKHPGVF
jgi:uncharacterized membrane protein